MEKDQILTTNKVVYGYTVDSRLLLYLENSIFMLATSFHSAIFIHHT